jgi:hypothetical protein
MEYNLQWDKQGRNIGVGDEMAIVTLVTHHTTRSPHIHVK